ncbi:hypothetical protein L249_8638 [Ophiocordyceps polyrhachis-furcata BCC 54312]|uniref:Xaa-Pro aminopeptidase n=1 Tax=Ophiocordyceps polyrhachis-furcata BCC 54312 TaxID=1330021 RepID=A0A367L6B4_9HYPO|nr:hypothetical protein L249_8638 [Ophiocordyceps polyrhachis-furcata BCC 54312]
MRLLRPLIRSFQSDFLRSSVWLTPGSGLFFRRALGRRRSSTVPTGALRFVTPGISAQEYADRRAALANALPAGSVAVLSGATLRYKSGAVFYPFRQETNLFWLTGWNEPDAVALISKTGSRLGDCVFQLFVRPKDAFQEQWSGYRNGVDAATEIFNADSSQSIDALGSALPRILDAAKYVYADTDSTCATTVQQALSKVSAKTKPLSPLMNDLRVIKSPAEIANMRKAGRASGRAITDAMRKAWTGERDLHAFLDYQFIVNGCEGTAYIPVIAGGDRANCIHYTSNNDVFGDGEFILVDAGGEYGSYISDISRTWPVSGRFTPAQRDLYEAVLRVQRSCVSLCRESASMSLEDIHGVTVRGLLEELKALGFDVTSQNVQHLFPHHVGHYIGLDVHDCPGYSRREKLRKGHCVTIEPGVYVPDDERWPSHFRGMGIRIEDSVCVDDDSPYILSTEAVKEVDDIEALRS